MPIGDYDKYKPLDISSVSGTPTVDKAQPILLLSSKTVQAFDGFEDGDFSSNPSWSGSATVTSNVKKRGTNSVLVDGTQSLTHDRGSNDGISDGDIYTLWLRSNDTGSNHGFTIGNQDTFLGGNDSIVINANSTGNIALVTYDSSGSLISANSIVGGYSANSWYRVEVEINPSSSDVIARVYDDSNTEIGSSTANTSGASNLQYVRLSGGGNSSSEKIWFDNVSYSATSTQDLEDISTQDGRIYVDFSNISDAKDIAVYDQNDNLLDYEIESLDTNNNTAVLWAYNSWARDGSTQAKIAYGDNSANTDRSNTTGTWNNTAQNAVMVQHLQDDPLTATDSTANNNDGTVNGATATSGQFDSAASFDGVDDSITVSDSASLDISGSNLTLVSWSLIDSSATDYYTVQKVNNPSGPRNGYSLAFHNTDQIRGRITTSNGEQQVGPTGTGFDDGEFHQIAMTYDGSTLSMYGDSALEESLSVSGDITTNNDNLGIGFEDNNPSYYDGDIDEVRVYNDFKSDAWVQADYDASPKGGQVFFSQQDATQTSASDTATPTTSSANLTVTSENITIKETSTPTTAATNLTASSETSRSTDTANLVAASSNTVTATDLLVQTDTATITSATANTTVSSDVQNVLDTATPTTSSANLTGSAETSRSTDTANLVAASANTTVSVDNSVFYPREQKETLTVEQNQDITYSVEKNQDLTLGGDIQE